MAGSLNKAILIGRLGSDPEIRYTASGMAVANFNIATSERIRGADGNWTEKTEWHRIVTFDRTAENCGNYLSKGRLVCVEGRIQTRQWEDAQGTKRYTTEIVAREVHFLGGAGDRAPQTQSGQAGMGGRNEASYQQSPPPSHYPEEGSSFSEELPPPPSDKKPDSDIPF
jgi:single-strand DNA-binding protein